MITLLAASLRAAQNRNNGTTRFPTFLAAHGTEDTKKTLIQFAYIRRIPAEHLEAS